MSDTAELSRQVVRTYWQFLRGESTFEEGVTAALELASSPERWNLRNIPWLVLGRFATIHTFEGSVAEAANRRRIKTRYTLERDLVLSLNGGRLENGSPPLLLQNRPIDLELPATPRVDELEVLLAGPNAFPLRVLIGMNVTILPPRE